MRQEHIFFFAIALIILWAIASAVQKVDIRAKEVELTAGKPADWVVDTLIESPALDTIRSNTTDDIFTETLQMRGSIEPTESEIEAARVRLRDLYPGQLQYAQEAYILAWVMKTNQRLDALEAKGDRQ